jgi:TfoX/Sxy family transcriptional regulator of competence genes
MLKLIIYNKNNIIKNLIKENNNLLKINKDDYISIDTKNAKDFKNKFCNNSTTFNLTTEYSNEDINDDKYF